MRRSSQSNHAAAELAIALWLQLCLVSRVAVFIAGYGALWGAEPTQRDGREPISVTASPERLTIIGTNEWVPIMYTFTNHTDREILIQERLAWFLSFDHNVGTANGPLATSVRVSAHSTVTFSDTAYFPRKLMQQFQKENALESGSFLFVQMFTARLDYTKAYSVAVPVPVAVIDLPSASESEVRIPIPEEVSLNKGAGLTDLIYLTLLLEGGEELLFVLDTGLGNTILDESLGPKLGNPIGMTSIKDVLVGKEKPAAMFRAVPLFIGKTPLRTSDRVVTQDFSLFREILGRPIMGFLGVDCLMHYCIQLDFDSGKLRFLDPNRPADTDLGKAIPLTMTADGRCTVRENLLGLEGIDSIVDTGFTETGSLEHRLFGEATKDGKVLTVAAGTVSASGLNAGLAGRFPECRFGGETYRNLILNDSQTTTIGLRFIARHLVTFDFPRSRMHLKPRNSDFPEDEIDMSGLYVAKKDGDTVVIWVTRNSPADRAGLRAGDLVLKVNDRLSNTLEVRQLEALLQSGHGKKLRLAVQRDGKQKRFTIILKRRI